MKAADRAQAAADQANQHHQGSGIHADSCAGWAQNFEDDGHQEVAELWADAAEAEAKYLAANDDWDQDRWEASDSAKATAKATAAAEQIDPEFEFE